MVVHRSPSAPDDQLSSDALDTGETYARLFIRADDATVQRHGHSDSVRDSAFFFFVVEKKMISDVNLIRTLLQSEILWETSDGSAFGSLELIITKTTVPTRANFVGDNIDLERSSALPLRFGIENLLLLIC